VGTVRKGGLTAPVQGTCYGEIELFEGKTHWKGGGAFPGLIVRAIAGNGLEDLAGVPGAHKNRGDLSMSLILNSALQVVLFLAPVLVILSFFVAPVPMTLVFDPLLLGTLVVTALLIYVIVDDGEANAFEGAMLLGLYAIVAAAVWWGPRIGA